MKWFLIDLDANNLCVAAVQADDAEGAKRRYCKTVLPPEPTYAEDSAFMRDLTATPLEESGFKVIEAKPLKPQKAA